MISSVAPVVEGPTNKWHSGSGDSAEAAKGPMSVLPTWIPALAKRSPKTSALLKILTLETTTGAGYSNWSHGTHSKLDINKLRLIEETRPSMARLGPKRAVSPAKTVDEEAKIFNDL